MSHALLAILANIALFAGAGIGPLRLLAPTAGPLTVAALAPAMGYALASVSLACWIMRGGTVAPAILPLTVALLAGSAACLLASGRGSLRAWLGGLDRRRALLGISGLALCLGLLAAPLAAGNRSYAVFRGNATDSFIYMYLAHYLDGHSRDWALLHSAAEIAEADPLLPPTLSMLDIRWTSGAMLAFGARLAGMSLPDFQYPFTLSLLAMFFAALTPFLRAMGLSPGLALTAALALTTGFFAQFVLDIRAFSQLSLMPLTVLLAWAASLAPASGRGGTLRRVLLLGVSYLACFVNYTEIFPMLVAAMAAFHALKLLAGRLTLRETATHAAGFACAMAATWPVRYLFGFLLAQIGFTGRVPRAWGDNYFAWLYADVPAGIFGLSLPTNLLGGPLGVLAAVLGCGLALLFAVGALRALADRERAAPLAALSLALASLAAFGLFWLRGQPWVAGKGLSYFYPYIAAVALYAAGTGAARAGRLAAAGKALAVAFLGWQFLFAGLRPAFARADADYPRYVGHHGSYRAVDCNLAPIREALRREGAANVAVCAGDAWNWSLAALSLARDHRVRLPAQMAGEASSGDAVFAVFDRAVAGALPELAPHLVARNNTFALYRLPRHLFADIAPRLACPSDPF